MNSRAEFILDFWFNQTSQEKRCKRNNSFDQEIRDKFFKDYELAKNNEYDSWQDNPKECLALIILLDQFSRNLFRDNKQAFDLDLKARLIVNEAIYSNYLEDMDQAERLFMLLPLIHSEEIIDHEKAYRLMDIFLKDHANLNEIKKFWMDHTKAIRKFNRYPHRNKILGRTSTIEEIQFLESPNSSW